MEADTYQITVADGRAFAAPRKTSRDINRHKASDCQPQPGARQKVPGEYAHGLPVADPGRGR